MLEVQICVGSSCHIRGSAFIIQSLQEKIKAGNLQDEVELKAQFCMGDCLNGVCMTISGEKVRDVYKRQPDKGYRPAPAVVRR